MTVKHILNRGKYYENYINSQKVQDWSLENKFKIRAAQAYSVFFHQQEKTNIAKAYKGVDAQGFQVLKCQRIICQSPSFNDACDNDKMAIIIGLYDSKISNTEKDCRFFHFLHLIQRQQLIKNRVDKPVINILHENQIKLFVNYYEPFIDDISQCTDHVDHQYYDELPFKTRVIFILTNRVHDVHLQEQLLFDSARRYYSRDDVRFAMVTHTLESKLLRELLKGKVEGIEQLIDEDGETQENYVIILSNAKMNVIMPIGMINEYSKFHQMIDFYSIPYISRLDINSVNLMSSTSKNAIINQTQLSNFDQELKDMQIVIKNVANDDYLYFLVDKNQSEFFHQLFALNHNTCQEIMIVSKTNLIYSYERQNHQIIDKVLVIDAIEKFERNMLLPLNYKYFESLVDFKLNEILVNIPFYEMAQDRNDSFHKNHDMLIYACSTRKDTDINDQSNNIALKVRTLLLKLSALEYEELKIYKFDTFTSQYPDWYIGYNEWEQIDVPQLLLLRNKQVILYGKDKLFQDDMLFQFVKDNIRFSIQIPINTDDLLELVKKRRYAKLEEEYKLNYGYKNDL
ncbi:UNKNOWN [Stylonychia lemnae]|uniref:Uncharacterized protein n=1 Tax=Stylonychia lemnae TaxID=5949 RepID=A0A078AZN9_STYLE|nr:UNKNOWN [Stylonychia lemnae]|eukprot:CDW87875.1 UNKNOWN [Stylonychia lemnae]